MSLLDLLFVLCAYAWHHFGWIAVVVAIICINRNLFLTFHHYISIPVDHNTQSLIIIVGLPAVWTWFLHDAPCLSEHTSTIMPMSSRRFQMAAGKVGVMYGAHCSSSCVNGFLW